MSTGSRGRGWRVLNEIVFIEPAREGFRYAVQYQDVSRRADIVIGHRTLSDAVKETIADRFPEVLEAPGLVVHGTSSRIDRGVVLTWAVTSPRLHFGNELGVRLMKTRAVQAKKEGAEPLVVGQAISHLSFLARRNTTEARAMGVDPAFLGMWRRIPGQPARDLSAGIPAITAMPSPGVREPGSLWSAEAGIFTFDINVAKKSAGFAFDQLPLTRDNAVRDRSISLDRRVDGFVHRKYGSRLKGETATQITSWCQSGNSIRFHVAEIPDSFEMSGLRNVGRIDLNDLSTVVAGDATAPDKAEFHPMMGPASHAIENIGQQMASNPELARLMRRVPGRERLMRTRELNREMQGEELAS